MSTRRPAQVGRNYLNAQNDYLVLSALGKFVSRGVAQPVFKTSTLTDSSETQIFYYQGGTAAFTTTYFVYNTTAFVLGIGVGQTNNLESETVPNIEHVYLNASIAITHTQAATITILTPYLVIPIANGGGAVRKVALRSRQTVTPGAGQTAQAILIDYTNRFKVPNGCAFDIEVNTNNFGVFVEIDLYRIRQKQRSTQ